MIIALASQFHVYLPWEMGNNLGGALSVIVKTDCETDGLSATLLSTRDTPQTLLDYCLLHTDNDGKAGNSFIFLHNNNT